MSVHSSPLLDRIWKAQRLLIIVWLGVLIYTLAFTAMSLRRYESFSFSDFDLAIFTHECWKAVHGSLQISMFNDVSILGNALELISIVTAPLYVLFGGDPRGLLFGQSLALGAGAIPVFLIARRRLPESMAVFWAYSYLFYPALWYSNLYEYYPIVYATFTLLMAYYYYDQKRFGWFMVFILLSLVNRVDVGVVTAMFGAYALFDRRSRRWVLTPFVLSASWVLVGLFVIIPAFNQSIYHDSHYSQYGKGFGQILGNMVLHPQWLWTSLTTPGHGKYFVELFFPVAFLPFAGIKEFLICSLSLFQHLVSQRSSEYSIDYHYTATITPFVYISAICGMQRWLATRHQPLPRIMYAVPVVLTVLANCLYGPLSQPKEYVDQLVVDEEDVYKRKMLEEIPKDAPIVSSFEFSPMLAGRERFYSFHFIYDGDFLNKQPYPIPADIQYALVNFSDIRMLGFQKSQSAANIRNFIASGPFGVVDRINSVVLLKKGYQSPLKMYEIVQGAPDLPTVLEVKDMIKLLRADHQLTRKRGQAVLSMVYQWAVPHPIADNVGVWMRLTDAYGKEIQTVARSMCYGALPTNRWKYGESYIEYFDWLLPSTLKSGEYKLSVSVFSETFGQFLPVIGLGGEGQGEDKKSVLVYRFLIP